MRKRVLKSLFGISALAMVFTTASCGLEDLTGLIPMETTTEEGEDNTPTTTVNNDSDPTTTKKEQSESKIEKLAKEKGYEAKIKFLDESKNGETIRFGCKNNTVWYENVNEESQAVAIDLKDNGDALYYSKEDGSWKYEGFFNDNEISYDAFNIYQALFVEPQVTSEFKKGISTTVAGRKCDTYSYTAVYLTTSATVNYCVDQEYGILLKMSVEGTATEGMAAILAFETLEFTVNPSKPNLPEPADYKNANPDSGSSWDLFKTVGLEELVPAGYASIDSLMSTEEEGYDYSYAFKFDGLTKEQVQAKFRELVSSYDTILKSKGDEGKLYQKHEWDKDDLEEIEAFVAGYYDEFEADGAILVGDTLYWVTLAYVDYYGPEIAVQVRVYSYAE